VLRSLARKLGLPGILAIAISLLGLSLRIEHALTFDGPRRGSDYGANMSGVRWMMKHRTTFDFRPDVNSQVQYQPPLWFAMGGVLLSLTGSERSIAGLAVVGWVIRQALLALILRRMIPERRWSILAALAINAVLPVSILTDGKVNPEGLHSTLFTVGVYFLWRAEREASRPRGISRTTALLFGLFAGLALLVKATASILPIAATLVLVWRAKVTVTSQGWRAAGKGFLVPAAVAAATWSAIAGWWVVPNLLKYKHPFPHIYAFDPPNPQPILYRRPLGWMSPFDWKDYLEHPVLVSGDNPRPNFWSLSITGTWSDALNRGFCRLKGDKYTDQVWGAQGTTWGGRSTWVSLRCMDVFRWMLEIGRWLTLVALMSTVYMAWRNVRSGGSEGSLAFPVVVLLGGFFVMLFALTYVWDGEAVINARYFLPTSVPISVCLAFGLARFERSPTVRGRIVLGATLAAIAAMAFLVVYIRWGR
jgi:hypothetical protein